MISAMGASMACGVASCRVVACGVAVCGMVGCCGVAGCGVAACDEAAFGAPGDFNCLDRLLHLSSGLVLLELSRAMRS